MTGVDARGRALPEAGKAAHLDFAAPGADMAAALPGQGYARVRGTSFAAPLATARLASTGSVQRLAAEARPGRGRSAADRLRCMGGGSKAVRPKIEHAGDEVADRHRSPFEGRESALRISEGE